MGNISIYQEYSGFREIIPRVFYSICPGFLGWELRNYLKARRFHCAYLILILVKIIVLLLLKNVSYIILRERKNKSVVPRYNSGFYCFNRKIKNLTLHIIEK